MMAAPRYQVSPETCVSGPPGALMPPRPLLTDREADLIAARLRLVGQPLRVRLVDRLAARSTTVHELVERLGETTQQNVSRHLGILHQAGIVVRHKEGRRARYELVDPHILCLFERAAASLPSAADRSHGDGVVESPAVGQ
jgi:DNA-binding transcriptional ArsR family regulator